MIKYFPVYWMGKYYIVKAEVIKETRTKWHINVYKSKTIFGKYKFLKSEIRKGDYPGFDTIKEATNWIVDHIEKRIAQSQKITSDIQREKSREQERINQLLQSQVKPPQS